jgi:hypothetical protein
MQLISILQSDVQWNSWNIVETIISTKSQWWRMSEKIMPYDPIFLL